MELSLLEAVVVPPVMTYDAITTGRNSVSTTGMSYHGIMTGRSSSSATGNGL